MRVVGSQHLGRVEDWKESIVVIARVVEEIQAVIDLFEEFQKRSKLP